MRKCPVRRWVICLWKDFINRKFIKDRENGLFTLWFLWMAVYYGIRMFALTPWYDELYTYYYFISRGPVYAAIHWPLPNNHVGYSVLSGFLNLFGNPVIGLRGISYLAALVNLVLLYRIGRKCFSCGWSVCCVLIYSCMNLVNQLAVQGRGYTLAVSCFLMAICMLQEIGWKEGAEGKKDFIYYGIFSLSLTLGLYILPSSVYWVIPVCITGGIFLLSLKKIRPLAYLIISSLVAAFQTLLLYAVIWLAIGSNLLSKTEGGAFYGQGHIGIICSAPFLSLRTGMDYMLATPYIQSVERQGYLARLLEWFRSLFNLYYPRVGVFLLIVTAAGIVFAILWGWRKYRAGDKAHYFLPLLTTVVLLLMPVFLIIQCTLPYFRVYSYIGIPVAMLLCCLGQMLEKYCWERNGKAVKSGNVEDLEEKRRRISFSIPGIAIMVCALLSIALLVSKEYNGEYGMSEFYAKDALKKAGVQEGENLCVTDCYQQYLLKFYYGIECENQKIEEADTVLLHREMTMSQTENFRWEFYQTYDTIPWEWMENEMNPVYENEEYIVYKKK